MVGPLMSILGSQVITELIKSAPKILGEAIKLYESIKRSEVVTARPTTEPLDFQKVSVVLDELRTKTEGLETQNHKQAELIAQLAAQGTDLANGLRIVNRRATALLITSAIAVTVAVVALGSVDNLYLPARGEPVEP